MKNFLKDKNNLIMLAILGFALSLRLLGLSKGLWKDEYGTVDIITRGNLLQVLLALRTDTHPPLYFILLKFWSYISLDEIWLRLLSVILGMGTIWFSMKWIKKYSLLASNLAGLCLAILPVMLRFSQELRPYPLLIFAAALSFYFASQLISEPRQKLWYFALSISMSVAVATHFVGIMLIFPVCAYILLVAPDKEKIDYKTMIIMLILPCVLFLLISFWHLNVMTEKYHNWWVPTPNIIRILFITRHLSGITSIMVFFRFLEDKIAMGAAYLKTSFILGMSLLTILILFFGRWRSSYPLLAAALIYWGQLIAFSIWFVPIFTDRAALPGIIPLTGFVFVKMATINSKKIKTASIMVFIFICILFSANWIFYKAWRPEENIREIVKIMEPKWDKNSLYILYPNYKDYKSALKNGFQNLSADRFILIPPKNNSLAIQNIGIKGNMRYPSKLVIFFLKHIAEKQDFDMHRDMVSSVKHNFTRPLAVEVFLIIQDDVCISRRVSKYYADLITHLATEFGPPVMNKKYKGLVYSEYRIGENAKILER